MVQKSSKTKAKATGQPSARTASTMRRIREIRPGSKTPCSLK
jgi:hypothetical protein